MNTVAIQQVTVTHIPAGKGGNMLRWNYDLDGKPFGQIWTFRNTRTERHGYHAKTLPRDGNGEKYAGPFARIGDADIWMRGEM